MRYRDFGKTGVKISEVGFGGWGIGGIPWGRRNDERSKQALNVALDLGVNFFDTAYVYGNGHSEELVGEVLRQRRVRKKVFIATKIPPYGFRILRSECNFNNVFPRQWIRKTTERSLRKLKTDYLDLQQFHTWLPDWFCEDDWLEEVDKMKKEGKIRWFGISIRDYDPDSAVEVVRSGMIDSVQVIYNIFEQSPSRRLFKECLKRGVAVIARSPLNEGSLSGSFNSKTKFPENDWRHNYFKGRLLREICKRTSNLMGFLGEEASTLPQLALKFCLSHSAVSTVIPGMRHPDHVRRNVAVVSKHYLASETLQSLKRHAWTSFV